MRAKKARPNRFSGVVLCLFVCSIPCADARADALASARMLSDDTMIMVSVESIRALREAIKKTSHYELYQDPAMREFVKQAEETIRKQIDEGLKKFWST